MLLATADFFQTGAYFLILGLLLGDFRKADNGIHGRADIVTHMAEKLPPGLVGLLLQQYGAPQLLILFLQADCQGLLLGRQFPPGTIVSANQATDDTHDKKEQ